MSDARIREALEQLEAWLSEPGKVIETSEMAGWNAAFFSAVETAEQGPGWQDLVLRARALGQRLEANTEALVLERDAIKAELDTFARGNRALKAYGASAR